VYKSAQTQSDVSRTLNGMAESTVSGDLRASEVRYRRLFEAARDGILILDAATGEVTAVNPFLAELLGYTRAEVLGKKLWELSPFRDIADNKVAFKQLQREQYIRYDDLPLETRDGHPIAVEFVSNIYESDDERVIQCNIRDITDRKRHEVEKRASDERYRSLFDSAADGILIADAEGIYLDANPSVCRMLGYRREDLIGLSAAHIVAPADHAQLDRALATITTRGDCQREWQFRRKDGSDFYADVIVTVTPDGNLLAMIRDLTARNQANDALRTAEERMRFSLESANVGIWDMDYASGRNEWSDVMEAQYGLPPGSFPGTFDAFVALVHPEDRASVLATIERAASTGSDFSVLHRATLPDGTLRWLDGIGHVHLGEHGQPVRAVGISLDVTERHALEVQFQQAQKMEAVGRMAGGIAHDFNNLLTVILGFCELLYPDLEGDRHRRDVAEIQKAATRATELTRQLLAFGRKQIIEPMLLDLTMVLREMEPMLGRLIREDVTVVLELGAALGTVKADRGQVEQVVVNLALNAQDAMPVGGTLTIEAANCTLDEHYAATHVNVDPGPYLVLTVTDTGVGMTPEVRERLFEPFFTTKPVGKGTGLGLATVYGIVTRSGGSVSVVSEVGQGTSMQVYLPQVEGPADAALAPAADAPVRGGREAILVVEDAAPLRELTRRILERLGYEVMVAGNAEEATQLFDAHPVIELLLTDVVMPGPSGPELTQQLVKRRPGLKVIYMSGYTDETIVQHGMLKAGIAFLHKPFTARALGSKIRETLDK
jgi:PAS domain S-box-containing protein